MNLRELYYLLTPAMRLKARKLYYLPADFIRLLSGRRSELVPGKGDIYTGSGDFIEQGKQHLKLLKELADLKPDDSVLDVGSGIGRTAVALTGFINSEGCYEGFDVVKKGVKWCNEKITPKFPNFNFQYVPLKNDLYNAENGNPADFTFPYPDENFDLVFLFSVFTHMQPPEIEHYLDEIYRVLKSGGRCLATIFFFDEDIENAISKKNTFNFPVKKDGYRLMNINVTSANVALEGKKIFNSVKNRKFEILKVIPGYWKDINNKGDLTDFQDIIIFKKQLKQKFNGRL